MMLFQRRYLLELLWNSISTLLVLLAVLMVISVAEVVGTLDKISLLNVLRTLPIFSATALHLIVPVSVLVSIVVTYGRATGDNEVDALRASGVHPVHLFLPGLIFGALASVLMLVTLDYAEPWAERASRRIKHDVDFASVLAQRLTAREPVHIGRLLLSARGVDEDGTPVDVRVQQFDLKGLLEREIVAKQGELFIDDETSEILLRLHDWRVVRGDAAAGESMDLSVPMDDEDANLKLDHMTTPQLVAWLDRAPDERARFKQDEVIGAIHGRMARAATCIVFVLVGLPVAVLMRRKDRIGAYLVAFILALFVYYPALVISNELVDEGLAPPVLASWSCPALLGLLGLVLSFRVVRR